MSISPYVFLICPELHKPVKRFVEVPDGCEAVIVNQIKDYEPVEDKISRIAEVVAEHFGLTVPHIQAVCRKRDVVMARQIAMYLMNLDKRITLTKIGAFFGHKDHTTVIHSRIVVNDLMHTDASYKKNVDLLKAKVGIV